jgi:glucose repression regulatory protein TUP1
MQEIYSLDFSRDGRYLVSGSGDKSARVWDIEKGTCVFDLRIEDFIHNEHGPIDAGITSVACESESPCNAKEFADIQYHPMENLSLLDLWIQWSEYGTLRLDNNSKGSRVTRTVFIRGSLFRSL